MSLPFISTLFGMIVALGIIIVTGRRRVQAKATADQMRVEEYRARERRAVWASAAIVNVRRTSVAADSRSKARIDLTLQVQPSLGDPCSARVAWHADFRTMAQLVPGATVSIKIDASKPQVIYPNMSGSEYWVMD